MKITTDWLVSRDACADQIAIFAAEWPDGAELTERNLLRAAELHLDLYWLARCILPPQARAEYERVEGPAWAEYERVRDQARAEYERVKDQARAEYERVEGPARAEYERVRDQALWASCPADLRPAGE